MCIRDSLLIGIGGIFRLRFYSYQQYYWLEDTDIVTLKNLAIHDLLDRRTGNILIYQITANKGITN